jgi:flagellar biosynthesis activator protein FlaF
MSSKTPSNPYAHAASTYGTHAQQHTPDQRETEARILLKAAQMFKEIQDDWDNLTKNRDAIEAALKYNRNVWMLFYDTAVDNPEGNRPRDLRSNIANLANFIFKREIDIMAEPKKEKLDILITINREIAAGLLSKPAEAPAEPPKK